MEKLMNTYFSVSFELVTTYSPLPYSLFINSSSVETREHFVKLYAKGSLITKDMIKEAKVKYFQFYVNEDERKDFLKSLVSNKKVNDIEKSEFIKKSAIVYLEKLFDGKRELNTKALAEILQDCRATVRAMVSVLKHYDMEKVQKLIANLSIHDFYTYDHSINVSMYCISLFQSIKKDATEKEIILAGLGGLLHDIGKTKISTELINKPFVLTEVEQASMSKHPRAGYDLLTENECQCEGIDFEILKRVVYEHHENYDGTGYPNRLGGLQIHFMSRLTTIADIFDALTTHRAYHRALDVEMALKIMNYSKGKKVDPHFFDIFTNKIDKLIFKAEVTQALAKDFDPCQPQNILSLVDVKKNYEMANIAKKMELAHSKKTKKSA